MENLWKEAFPVGVEWDQIDKVHHMGWEFTELEEAFEPGGVLHGQTVWLFGCTEPQHIKSLGHVIHVPAIIAVVSPIPPSDKLGVKSVQRVEEEIVSMKSMKMAWVPFIPDDENKPVERIKDTKIHVIRCTQRKAALKRINEEKMHKYDYLLPYMFKPDQEEEVEFDTGLSIIYEYGEKGTPPIVAEYDWKFDKDKDAHGHFKNEFINEEFLEQVFSEDSNYPAEERDKFWQYCLAEGETNKAQYKEEMAARKRKREAVTPAEVNARKEMKVYKFYPSASENTPDILEFESAFVNRYYGKAHQTFPPPLPPKAFSWGNGNTLNNNNGPGVPTVGVIEGAKETGEDDKKKVNGQQEGVSGLTEGVNGQTEGVNGSTERVNEPMEGVIEPTAGLNGEMEGVNGSIERADEPTEVDEGTMEGKQKNGLKGGKKGRKVVGKGKRKGVESKGVNGQPNNKKRKVA